MTNAWELLSTVLLKSTIIIAAAHLLSLAMRRASAAARHLVWTAALASLLILPLLSLGLPHWSPSAAALPELSIFAAGLSPAPSDHANAGWSWRFVGVAVWVAGAAVMLGRLAYGLVRAALTVRSAERWQAPRPEVAILRSEHAPAPFVWGLFRPVIEIGRAHV